MNLYLYGAEGKWLMVDLGITFSDESTPGIDVIMPDIAFIEQAGRDLLGLVLTHAHEDHFGAVQYLWPRLRCPVYATPFTAALLRLKLQETDFAAEVKIVEVPLSGSFKTGPFDVELVTVTHSIPEPNALVIRTRHGAVVHSGDWKLDPEPVLGKAADSDRFREIGEAGVLALIGDSTNAMVSGSTGSESEVRAALEPLIAGCSQRVALACFASNVARLQSISEAAYACGRHCALVGRSLWRMHQAATETGYLKPPEPFVTEHDVGFLPRDKVVMVVTGSQGEPRAALTRIAQGEHANVTLEEGDTVLFSSRDIPGNEKAIGRVRNLLVSQGVRVITPDDAPGEGPIHVSGHPARDELVSMYQWLQPQTAIPVHGETQHLRAHAELARSCQVPQTLIPEDGALIRLAPGRPAIVDRVAHGRMALDGTRLIRVEDSETIRERHRMAFNGVAIVTVVLNRQGRVADAPQIAMMGVDEGEALADLEADLEDILRDAVGQLPTARRRDDETVRETARIAVRRAIRHRLGKKPMTQIHLVRQTGRGGGDQS
ncbi:MAG: ribonuclease J [Inquilinus sp.]|nr:ribonuclease J [Inquilinus sp.]